MLKNMVFLFKYHIDWHCRKSSNDFLYFYGDLYWRFYKYLSSKKQTNKQNINNKQEAQYIGLKSNFFLFNSLGWRYSTMKNLQHSVPFSLRICIQTCASKNIRVVVKMFQCRSRPNFSEDACQKSCESNQNQESYGQKEAIYFKEPLIPVPPLHQCYRNTLS